MAAPSHSFTEPGTTGTRVENSENKHPYESLAANSFRLLELQPGELDDPIHARLLDAAFDDAPSYDALSYVWGDETDILAVHCNGTPFNITTNLHWALTRVRLANSPRMVWADAICINQNNLEERSEQVSLIGRIYNSANKVFAYFKDASAETANGLMSLVHDLEPTMTRGELSALKDTDPLWNESRL